MSQPPISLLYVNNIITHHQLPIATEFSRLIGNDNFRYAAIDPVPNDLIRGGWRDDSNEAWLLKSYANEENNSLFLKWWVGADVAITGSRDITLLRQRVESGKLTFYMSERWWKPPIGKLRLLHPGFVRMSMEFFALTRHSNFHYLPMGYYAATDLTPFSAFKNRIWQWAYFTETTANNVERCNYNSTRLLWVGRMLSWKQVDVLLRAVGRLYRQGFEFTLDLIGHGPEKEYILKLRNKLNLESVVHIHPPVPAAEVRNLMRKADIYILPSNSYEGWGAVVNEAMSEGCLVIASREAGSAQVLIEDGVNGLLFRSGDDRQLASILARAITDHAWRKHLAKAGYRTIHDLWNPCVAAHRLVSLANGLLGRAPMPNYSDGPCSSIRI